MKDILVIDDSGDLRSMIAATLVYSGYSVRQAPDGREGIKMVIAQRPDLILCDVKMPGLDGYHTLEAIRKCSGTAGIPFILMTGSMGQKDFRHGMVAGADDYLIKPFTVEELTSAVKSRFARQSELQTDIFRRLEQLHADGFRQLSKELAERFNGTLTGSEPAGGDGAMSREIVVAPSQNEVPVYCLD